MYFSNKICVVALLVAVGGSWTGGAGARKSTRVVPHMEVPITAGENVVYCSTFQIAWKDMKDRIVGEDIRLEKPLETVARLNKALSTEADISTEDYIARAGVGSDAFVDDLNRALLARFGGDAPRVGDRYRSGERILAYAFLKKDLRFEHPFEVFENPVAFYTDSGRALVDGFGIGSFSTERHAELRDQVEIVDYAGGEDFVIRLRSARPDEEIILANVPPGETLLATFAAVDDRVRRSAPARMEEHDVLMIPMLDVSVGHSYDELLGLFLLNDGFEEYFVDEAFQGIRFNMNQRGVSVDSEAKFVLEKKGPPPGHKLLVFDDPFVLYLKQKGGKYPYFAVWVGNRELMVPSS
jgi:hypothetical protein